MSFTAADGVQRYKALIRLTRLISLGGAVLFGGICSYFAASAIVGPGWTRVTLFVTAFALLFAALSAIGGLWKWSPGAVDVSVDERGIRFE